MNLFLFLFHAQQHKAQRNTAQLNSRSGTGNKTKRADEQPQLAVGAFIPLSRPVAPLLPAPLPRASVQRVPGAGRTPGSATLGQPERRNADRNKTK